MWEPVLVPAYGRDYKSKREVEEALNGPVDFKCEPMGGYTSGREIRNHHQQLNVRYGKLRKVCVAKWTGTRWAVK